MAAVFSRTAAGFLLAFALASAQREAEELSPALASDDECRADGGGAGCSLSALQRKLDVRKLQASENSTRIGSCMDYGCSGYVKMQLCQCNPECGKYGNCCEDFSDTCAGTRHLLSRDERGPIRTLYHQTSHEIGELILKEGFKPGSRGWCGGAMYFATSPRATITKASGLNSNRGFMVEAEVYLGKVKHMPSWCDMQMTGDKLWKEGYDSIVFNPIDGDEHVIYNSSQVLATRRFPFSWPR